MHDADYPLARPETARVSTPPDYPYAWYVRLILWLQRRKYGAELESARIWGRLPRAFLMLSLLYRSLDRPRSALEPGLRALVLVRVSQINWCAFCVDLNSATALGLHVAPEKLAALEDYERSALFIERERAVIAYAEAVTDPTRPVDDAGYTRLRAHFSEQEAIEITALIGFQNLSSKFNAALAVPAQGFCAPRGRPKEEARHES
ncbi:MAG: carboxymuconolactone decarboxylase family protein [Burkholderiales bacterium]